MTYVEEYNIRVRRINALRGAIDNLNSATLGELGKVRKTKAEKRELKRLQKLEKAERLALHRLMSKKDRERLAKRTKKAKKKFSKGLKRGGGTGFIGKLNSRGAITLPLTNDEENLRAASVAGDFATMNQLAPFGPGALTWAQWTPLGKYRFEVINGKPVWIAWREQDIQNFLNGPWLIRNPKTGLAPLLHPRRKISFDKNAKLKKLMKRINKAAKKYPNTNLKHVTQINVGTYTYQHGLDSTWVKIRKPVAIAIAVVASVYLGPAILQAVQAAYASAAGALTGGAATASGTAAGVGAKATLASKVFAGAKTLSTYVNNARTVKAIVKGEEIPPPVGISGKNFGDWAFKVAQDEAVKQYGRKLTKDEERKMRQEIAAMQKQLAPIVKNVPLEQPPELPAAIKEVQNVEIVKAAKNDEMMKLLIPAGVAFLVMKGFA